MGDRPQGFFPEASSAAAQAQRNRVGGSAQEPAPSPGFFRVSVVQKFRELEQVWTPLKTLVICTHGFSKVFKLNKRRLRRRIFVGPLES